jgi:hypothetical protein
MAKVYLNTNTPLFKGMKGRKMAPLFWVTKIVDIANGYAQRANGATRVYKPARRLKLLKLSRESIRRLLQTSLFPPSLKHKLALMMGIGMSYRDQFEGLVKLNKGYWLAHFNEKYQNSSPNWMAKGGRISLVNKDAKLFGEIKDAIKHKYDGVYVPEVPTPHYAQGAFPAEYILFKPRQDLVNVTTAFNLNKARQNLYAQLNEMNKKREARLKARSS